MCIKTAGAEKTGASESRIWNLNGIEEKGNVDKTAPGLLNPENSVDYTD
jgi:hypothetical protein